MEVQGGLTLAVHVFGLSNIGHTTLYGMRGDHVGFKTFIHSCTPLTAHDHRLMASHNTLHLTMRCLVPSTGV